MSKVSVKDSVEKAQVEVALEVDGRPRKILFQSLLKDKTDAVVSFDDGSTWVEVAVAHASIAQFLDKYPFAIPQE
jgi:hypothetical protein